MQDTTLRTATRKRSGILVIRILLAFLGLVGLGAYWVTFHVLPYAIISPRRQETREIPEFARALRIDPFVVAVDPGIELRGSFVPALAGKSLGTVLILHGIGDGKKSQMGLARRLAEEQLNAVVYDARAHGESGGKYCSFGHFEKADVSRVLDAITRLHPAAGPFAGFATSYGGAVLLQALPQEPRLCCAVVESTFSNLRETVNEHLGQLLYFHPRWYSDMVLDAAGRIAHFDPDTIDPAESARRIQQPIRLLHGTADEDIPVRHGEVIFRNLASPAKQWVAVPGANHLNIWEQQGGKFSTESIEFLKAHLRSSAAGGSD